MKNQMIVMMKRNIITKNIIKIKKRDKLKIKHYAFL
jgi:hypothetical protein